MSSKDEQRLIVQWRNVKKKIKGCSPNIIDVTENIQFSGYFWFAILDLANMFYSVTTFSDFQP